MALSVAAKLILANFSLVGKMNRVTPGTLRAAAACPVEFGELKIVMRVLFPLFPALFLWASILPSGGADRVALIFGNEKYEHLDTLENAPNDASLLAETLRRGGFDVDLVIDASLETMEEKVLQFRRKAEEASAAWFYYAGHGIEVKGVNYLMPVDVKVEEEFQIKSRAFSLDTLLAALEEAGTPLKVIVLDCCRENPFGQSWTRSVSKGLSPVAVAPEGTIIAFAAAPGKVAADSVGGENSPYTLSLVEALNIPGLEIDQVFKETGRRVRDATAKQQQPWMNTSFVYSFVVFPKTGKGEADGPVPPSLPLPAAPKVPAPGIEPFMKPALSEPVTAVLSVGVNEIEKEGIPSLTAADNDAKKIAGAFRSVGASAERSIVMTSMEERTSPLYPSSSNLRAQLATAFSGLKSEDTAVFAFGGYEVQTAESGEYYLMTADGNNEEVSTLVTLSEVYQAITRSGAGTGLVLIDACRQGEVVGLPAPPPGVAVFFSCSRGEFARESNETEPPSGIFTDTFCTAIKGAGDLDEDGQVDWDELTGYVTGEVSRRGSEMGVSQIPEVFGEPGRRLSFSIDQLELPLPPSI